MQPNFCDCGVYLLHFAQTFLSDPAKYHHLITVFTTTFVYGTISDILVVTREVYIQRNEAGHLERQEGRRHARRAVNTDSAIVN